MSTGVWSRNVDVRHEEFLARCMRMSLEQRALVEQLWRDSEVPISTVARRVSALAAASGVGVRVDSHHLRVWGMRMGLGPRVGSSPSHKIRENRYGLRS